MEWQDLKQLSEEHPIVFFDGVCGLCNGFVNYVIRRDPKGIIKFCTLQDDTAQKIRKKIGLSERLDTVIGLHKGMIYTHSDVVFVVARALGGYSYILPFQWLPIRFRNLIYRWVAKNRYRWFGKQETCMIPSPDVSSRFL